MHAWVFGIPKTNIHCAFDIFQYLQGSFVVRDSRITLESSTNSYIILNVRPTCYKIHQGPNELPIIVFINTLIRFSIGHLSPNAHRDFGSLFFRLDAKLGEHLLSILCLTNEYSIIKLLDLQP